MDPTESELLVMSFCIDPNDPELFGYHPIVSLFSPTNETTKSLNPSSSRSVAIANLGPSSPAVKVAGASKTRLAELNFEISILLAF